MSKQRPKPTPPPPDAYVPPSLEEVRRRPNVMSYGPEEAEARAMERFLVESAAWLLRALGMAVAEAAESEEE